MKKIFIHLFIVALCFLLVGCNKESLIGTWERTYEKNDVMRTITFDFREDKTGVWTLLMGLGASQTKEFSYKIEDKKLIIMFNDNSPTIEYEYQFDGKSLIFKDNSGEKNIFKKK